MHHFILYHFSALIILSSLMISCSDSTTSTGGDNEEKGKLPVARFNYTINNPGNIPAEVQFSDSSSNTLSRLWSFGDGEISRELNPVFSFKESGRQTVRLIASNREGKDTMQVEVDVPPLEKPVAKFGVEFLDSRNYPIKVQLHDSSKFGSNYKWYFGNGESSTEQSPLINYADDGQYQIILRVSNDAGISIDSTVITAGLPDPKYTPKIIYFMPSDRTYHQNWRDLLKEWALTLQDWYKDNTLDGSTYQFDPNEAIIDTFRSRHGVRYFLPKDKSKNYYAGPRVKQEIFNTLGEEVTADRRPVMVFGDIGNHGQAGAGYGHISVVFFGGLQPEQKHPPYGGWIAGNGHEFGHAFGFRHPEGKYLPGYLMGGRYNWPDTKLHPENQRRAANSKYFYNYDN